MDGGYRLRHSLNFRPDDEVVPGVPFGCPQYVPTPAFWVALAETEDLDEYSFTTPPETSLAEEIAFCILGGYGVKMEVNCAVWRELRDAGVFSSARNQSPRNIELLLRRPITVNGRRMRYRFPRQRACRLSSALKAIRGETLPLNEPLPLRAALMKLPGIGPKTASWIVRNWTGSNEVAILDVHIVRAGQIMGLFPPHVRLPIDYQALEFRFLDFARAIQVPASLLDALIWREMRILGRRRK
ncbi:hypothetical protein [Dongia sp.]|uniref:8-oxoguanine DNA glycosylase n=1 Tax=Dongia sp. TaxID=1977262 RepID=UPI0037530905